MELYPSMKKLIGILVFALLPLSASAGLITFNLAGDSGDGAEGLALDGLESGYVTKGGVTARLSARAAAPAGEDSGERVLNQTSSSFGVNSVGDGCDVSAEVDANCFQEYIYFSFSEMVELVSITLTNYSSNDTAILIFQNPANVSIIPSSPSTTLVGAMIGGGLGDGFSIYSAAGNGFSVDRFTIRSVPEPGTLALFGLGIAGLGFSRRKAKL